MKTITTLMLLFIFGISGLKATSQSPADSVMNLLSRRWYLTKVSGGVGGGSYMYRPGAGDSLIIGKIPETDSITWDAYSQCKNTASYRYQVSYGTSMHGDGWMLNSLKGPSRSISILWKLNDGSYVLGLSDNCYDGYNYQYVTVDTFTLHKTPVVASTTGSTRCGPGEVTLEAKADPGTIKWYADSTGGAVMDTGTFFTTPVLDTTTVYYVEAAEGGCVTARVPVVAIISRHDTCMTTYTGSEMASSIRVYPNPTSGKVSIDFNGTCDGKISIDLVDSKGCFIRSIAYTNDDISTDLYSFPSGMYFIKLGLPGRICWVKVMKL
jgi:hypothetical protein